jgi:predicted amidophosphoribosyltransferase
VHALKYKRYIRLVERVMAPLMSDTHGGGRFDAVMPVPLHRMWLAKRRFNQAELMAKGVVGRIEGLVLDKLKVVRRTRIRSSSPPTSAGRTSRAPTRHEGPWRARSFSSTTSSPPAAP